MQSKFLYLDESGDPGDPPGLGGSGSTHFVYAGVVVDPEQNLEFKECVEYLMGLHFDEKGYDRPEELHYGDLINDRFEYSALEDIEKKELADDVFKTIKQVEPELIGSVIDKEHYFEESNDNPHPKTFALRRTVARFHRHINQEGSAGMVIADAERGEIDDYIQSILHSAKSKGIGEKQNTGSKIPRIMDSVAITPSEMSPGVQIADFVAYATFSAVERGKRERFEEISDQWKSTPDVDGSEPLYFRG